MNDMDNSKNRILLIEDDGGDQMAFKHMVREKNLAYDYIIADTVSEARKILDSETFDVVITDYDLGDGTAFDIFELISDTPAIVVNGGGDEGVAVKAMKKGAYDYVVKDRELNYLRILPVTIKNAIRRKEAEERLRLLESAVVNANDAIIILEAKPRDLPGRRILYVNKAFTEMTGYTFEEALNNTLRIFQGPETSRERLEKIRDAMNRWEPVRVELINYRKDGFKFWVECSMVPVADDKGTFTHWVSVQRDITDRKRAEGEREKLMKKIEAINADLSELNRELETIGAERTMSLMALTVADRVRNPASMIGGRCRRIMEKKDISEGLRKNLGYIIEGSEQLDKIVTDFETFLKNRQSKFRREDLNTVVERVVCAIEKEAAYKGVELVVQISPESLMIKMQKDLLRIAIFHIIKNAIEATHTGGFVKVETLRDRDYVVLTVSDTGYGIPERDVDNVFKPFYSTKEQGYGMGLPLVKQIVSEHLGEVVVMSGQCNGSTFRILFPVRWKEDCFY